MGSWMIGFRKLNINISTEGMTFCSEFLHNSILKEGLNKHKVIILLIAIPTFPIFNVDDKRLTLNEWSFAIR